MKKDLKKSISEELLNKTVASLNQLNPKIAADLKLFYESEKARLK